jgi:hypothetical protein
MWRAISQLQDLDLMENPVRDIMMAHHLKVPQLNK